MGVSLHCCVKKQRTSHITFPPCKTQGPKIQIWITWSYKRTTPVLSWINEHTGQKIHHNSCLSRLPLFLGRKVWEVWEESQSQKLELFMTNGQKSHFALYMFIQTSVTGQFKHKAILYTVTQLLGGSRKLTPVLPESHFCFLKCPVQTLELTLRVKLHFNHFLTKSWESVKIQDQKLRLM